MSDSSSEWTKGNGFYWSLYITTPGRAMSTSLISNVQYYYTVVGLIRVALLLYPPPTRPLGPLPDPYLIPRGYLIPTGQKIK